MEKSENWNMKSWQVPLNYIFNFGILIHLPTYLPTSQHHALSAQAAWLVRILQTVRSWAATSASSIDHPNHLIILEYWSFRCKNNWLELCMRNEQFKGFCDISFHTRCHLGSSCPYIILIHSKTKKSHKTQSKCQFFKKFILKLLLFTVNNLKT